MVKFLPAPPLGEVTVTSVRCIQYIGLRTEDTVLQDCERTMYICYFTCTMAIVFDLPSFVRVLMCHDWGRFVLCFVPHNVREETTESIELTNLCQPLPLVFAEVGSKSKACVSSS